MANKHYHSQSEATSDKQAFCPGCGRSYHLENHGTDDKPMWCFPIHKIRTLIGRGTKLCGYSNRNLD